MAVRLIGYNFRSNRTPSYPWGDWGDGNTWRVKYGEDFFVEPRHFAQAVYQHATSRGLKANVNIDDSTVTFRIVR